MFDDIMKSQCKLVCLGVGVGAGIIAIYAANIPTLPVAA